MAVNNALRDSVARNFAWRMNFGSISRKIGLSPLKENGLNRNVRYNERVDVAADEMVFRHFDGYALPIRRILRGELEVSKLTFLFFFFFF